MASPCTTVHCTFSFRPCDTLPSQIAGPPRPAKRPLRLGKQGEACGGLLCHVKLGSVYHHGVHDHRRPACQGDAEIGLLCPHQEEFANGVPERMGAGLPGVTADAPGYRDGMMVARGATAARAAEFDWDSVVGRCAALYERLVGEAAR